MKWQRILLFALILSAWLHNSRASAQTADRVTVQAPASPAKKRLRIDYGITNAEYRWQLFAITPLGTSYEQVAAFTRAEVCAEWPHVKEEYLRLYTRLWGEPSWTASRLFQEQPPNTKDVVRVSSVNSRMGADYTTVFFRGRQSFWSRGIILQTTYIFNKQHSLIDIICEYQDKFYE